MKHKRVSKKEEQKLLDHIVAVKLGLNFILGVKIYTFVERTELVSGEKSVTFLHSN
jgi:hypothetical protein